MVVDQAESPFRLLVHSNGMWTDRNGGIGQGRKGIPVSVNIISEVVVV